MSGAPAQDDGSEPQADRGSGGEPGAGSPGAFRGASGRSSRRLLAIQIDGLSRPVLERALGEGRVPAIAALLDRGSHDLATWCPGLPSQTSACQAGILFGDDLGIPAFRWFEKEHGRLMVSNHPGDAAEIERRAGPGEGLLVAGASVGNLLSGSAPVSTMTMSTLNDPSRRGDAQPFLTSPRFMSREALRMTAEIGRELGESSGLRRAREVEPRSGGGVLPRRSRRGLHRPPSTRGGSFPFLRAVSTVLLRDLTARVVAAEIERGVPAIYADFVGYDEVGHHTGPATDDSIDVLARLDPVLRRLLGAARARGYDVVLLSDHGQTPGTPFRARHGESLEQVVAGLTGASVSRGAGTSEGWGHVNGVLSELVTMEHAAANLWRLLLRPRLHEGYVETGPDRTGEREEPGEVVVCASGNLGHVYLTALDGRADAERISAAYPRLIEGLRCHPDIDFVLVRAGGRPIVLGAQGRRALDSGEVEGVDPLAKFGDGAEGGDGRGGGDAAEHAAAHLRELDRRDHVGDLVVNGGFDPARRTVAPFEELIGSHGGLGGPQGEAFIVAPHGWSDGRSLDGPASIHELLRAGMGEAEK